MCFRKKELVEKFPERFTQLLCCRRFIHFFLIGILINLGQFIYQGGNGDTWVSSIYQPGFGWESSLGRWLIQYVGNLRNSVVVPIYIELISIIILTAALLLIYDILDIHNSVYCVIGAALFFSQPYVSFMLHIYYCADAYSFSLFFAVLAAWFLLKFEKKHICSIICMVVSLSLYQSNIVITGTLVLICILADFLNAKKDLLQTIKKSILCFLSGLGGIVLYILLLKFYLASHNMALADYKGMNNIGTMNLVVSVKKLIELLNNMYFSVSDSLVGYSYWVNGKLGVIINIGIIICFIAYIVYMLFYKNNGFGIERKCLVVLCCAILPIMWGIIVFMAPDVSVHVLIMPHLIFIYLVTLSAMEHSLINKKKIIYIGRLIGLSSIIFVAYNYCFVAAEFQYGLKLADNRAYALATEINSRLEDEVCWEPGMKIAIIGDTDTWSVAPDYYNIYGKNECLYWPGYGSQGCWQKYIFERIGVYYTILSSEEYSKLVCDKRLKDMQVFPNNNSIQIIDDTVVVKLGNVEGG